MQARVFDPLAPNIIRELLHANPAIAALPGRTMDALVGALSVRTLKAGDALWDGEEADAFYVVGPGGRIEVDVTQDPRLEPLHLSPGCALGVGHWAADGASHPFQQQWRATAVVDCVVYCATADELAPLRRSRWFSLYPGGFAAWYELLQTDAILSVSPDLYDVLGQQRLELARMAERVARLVQPGEEIYGFDDPKESVWFMAFGGLARIERRNHGGVVEARYDALPGHLFGLECFFDDPGAHRAVAARPTWLWRIPAATIDERRRNETENGWLRRAVDRWLDHVEFAPQQFELLLQTRLFAAYRDTPEIADDGPSRSSLYELLRSGRVRNWIVGAAPPPPIGSVPGFGMVISGEITSYLPTGDEGVGDYIALGEGTRPIGTFRPGDVFGVETMILEQTLRRSGALGGPVVPYNCYRARTPSRILFFPLDAIERLFGAQEPFQIGVQRVLDELWKLNVVRCYVGMARPHAPTPAAVETLAEVQGRAARARAEGVPVVAALLPARAQRPALVLVQDLRTAGPHHEVSGLALAAARSIEEQFGEGVTVVEFLSGPPDASPGRPAAFDPDHRVQRLAVRFGDDADAAMQWLGAWLRDQPVADRAAGVQWVLVTVAPDLVQTADALRGAADRVAYVAALPRLAPPPPGPQHLTYTYLALSEQTPGATRPDPATYPAAATRMPLPHSVLAGWTPADGAAALGARLFGTAQPRLKLGIERFARGITDRRVGIALGSGGSWGMAHVAILKGLHQAGIPIDLVAGASVGSTVGAYYAAGSLAGLATLIDHRYRIQAGAVAGLVSLEPFRALVDRDTDGARVEELDLPFFPMATDLLTGSPAPISAGTLGACVRKSGSAPPIYAATNTDRGTYIDGGFSDNLPVDVLQTEGARLLIASDIIPPPPRRQPRPPRLEGLAPPAVARLISDVQPLRRLVALARGGLTLFHSGGNAQAARAPVHFDSAWTGTLPENMADGPQIIQDTLGSEGYWLTLQGASTRWAFLQRRALNPRL